jgi:hypothetical protein
MKFKVIFILFNIVIVVSFLVIYFMPLILLGSDYTAVFWSKNWGLPLLFIGIIGLLNGYFIYNWKLFTMLEREDWPGLITYLERKVYEKKMIVAQQVRILINAYLVSSNLEAINKLEGFLQDEKPAVLPRFALSFGIPYLLRNNSEEMESYFLRFIDDRGKDGEWIRWNYAFALILQGKKPEAEKALIKIPGKKIEPVLLLLAIYLLNSINPENKGASEIIDDNKARLKKRFTPVLWAREIERSRNNVQVVILSKLVEEATDWLYLETPNSPADNLPNESEAVH